MNEDAFPSELSNQLFCGVLESGVEKGLAIRSREFEGDAVDIAAGQHPMTAR
jgi:hypothetical protein